MIYDTKNRLLLNGKKAIKISKKKEKFLIALSSMELVTYEEVAKYIYNKHFAEVKMAIRKLKKELLKTSKLKIEVRYGLGYILETDIFFK